MTILSRLHGWVDLRVEKSWILILPLPPKWHMTPGRGGREGGVTCFLKKHPNILCLSSRDFKRAEYSHSLKTISAWNCKHAKSWKWHASCLRNKKLSLKHFLFCMPQFPPGSIRMRQNLWHEIKSGTNFWISVRGFEYVNDMNHYHVLSPFQGLTKCCAVGQAAVPAPH